MDFLLLAAAFLVGILIRPALVALARGETINFSMNFKYFGFRLRIGCRTHRPSQLSAMNPHSRTPLVPQLGPPPLSRALLAVSDPPNIDSHSAPCLLPGHDWDRAAPGRASGPFQSIGHRGTNPVLRAVRAGDSAKMPKRKPAPEEKPKAAIIIYEKSREETAPGDEPKKETNSDEESRHGTNHGDELNDGDNPEDDPKDGDNPGNNKNAIGAVIGATVGAGVALVGLPVCIGALGFTGAGIAAGSVAAKMMSAAAIANGGGVAAGSAVAVLQSIGAAGLSLGAKVGLTSVLSSAGAASGAWLSKLKKHPRDKPKNDKNPGDKQKKNPKTWVVNMDDK